MTDVALPQKRLVLLGDEVSCRVCRQPDMAGQLGWLLPSAPEGPAGKGRQSVRTAWSHVEIQPVTAAPSLPHLALHTAFPVRSSCLLPCPLTQGTGQWLPREGRTWCSLEETSSCWPQRDFCTQGGQRPAAWLASFLGGGEAWLCSRLLGGRPLFQRLGNHTGKKTSRAPASPHPAPIPVDSGLVGEDSRLA